jgi:hypothetical protein
MRWGPDLIAIKRDVPINTINQRTGGCAFLEKSRGYAIRRAQALSLMKKRYQRRENG